MEEETYSSKEVAELLGVTTRSIRNYLRDGRLTGQKFAGKWHFTQDDVQRFIQQEYQSNQNQQRFIDQEADYFSLQFEKNFSDSTAAEQYSQDITQKINQYLADHAKSSLSYFMQKVSEQRIQVNLMADLNEFSLIYTALNLGRGAQDEIN